MTKSLIAILCSALSLSCLNAQDIITKLSGEDVKVKVTEITLMDVKFKKFDNLDGPVYVVPKSEILIVRYENGTTETFAQEQTFEPYFAPPAIPDSNSFKGQNMYLKGTMDAKSYYRNYKAAGTVTLVTSLLYLPAGLVPAIACSAVRPNEGNLGYPSSELMKNSDYANGYTQEARRIKQTKVWTNFGIGFGVNVALFLVLYGLSN